MCVCVCWWELTFATSCGQLWGWWVEMGEPCHVFMLTNELITQPLIYFNLCHFTGMLQQSNACRLWVISWQLKANYYSSNSSTPQALNHKCYSRSICLFDFIVVKFDYRIRKWQSWFKQGFFVFCFLNIIFALEDSTLGEHFSKASLPFFIVLWKPVKVCAPYVYVALCLNVSAWVCI